MFYEDNCYTSLYVQVSVKQLSFNKRVSKPLKPIWFKHMYIDTYEFKMYHRMQSATATAVELAVVRVETHNKQTPISAECA